jgi:dCMP deaminase
MNPKWREHWMRHALLIASMSPCPRGKVGAFIIDKNNNPVSAGFNGPPRKSESKLCGSGDRCLRDCQSIESGTRTEIGCHHAEQNAIANAARKGVSLEDCWMVVSVPPCLACAKFIHHSGIKQVQVLDCHYSWDGVNYLLFNGVDVNIFSM